jgi:hypothetical protein
MSSAWPMTRCRSGDRRPDVVRSLTGTHAKRSSHAFGQVTGSAVSAVSLYAVTRRSTWGTLVTRLAPLVTEAAVRTFGGSDFRPSELYTSTQPGNGVPALARAQPRGAGAACAPGLGHAARRADRMISEVTVCGLTGCSEPALLSRSARGRIFALPFCLAHWRVRSRPPAEDGSRFVNAHGYIQVKDGGRWIGEHRLVMEQTLGRKLRRGEAVHHLNGRRDDNRPENLELWVYQRSADMGQPYGQRASELVCPHCGEGYLPAS